jgi:hypothetical protein
MGSSWKRPTPSGRTGAMVDNPPLLYVFAIDAKAPLPVLAAAQ